MYLEQWINLELILCAWEIRLYCFRRNTGKSLLILRYNSVCRFLCAKALAHDHQGISSSETDLMCLLSMHVESKLFLPSQAKVLAIWVHLKIFVFFSLLLLFLSSFLLLTFFILIMLCFSFYRWIFLQNAGHFWSILKSASQRRY